MRKTGRKGNQGVEKAFIHSRHGLKEMTTTYLRVWNFITHINWWKYLKDIWVQGAEENTGAYETESDTKTHKTELNRVHNL